MSYKTKTIRLPLKLSHGTNLQFLDAVLFEAPRLPFAIVHYSVEGNAQESGLRLDLDKQVFLDHFPDARSEDLATAAAPEIVSFLGEPAELVTVAAGSSAY